MILWITFTQQERHYPVTHNTTVYTNIAVFDDELQALRYANIHGCRVVEILPGQTLGEAISADKVDTAMAKFAGEVLRSSKAQSRPVVLGLSNGSE